MSISDWGSDVCSSDLVVRSLPLHPLARIIARLLVGALGDGEALEADIEPRIVHHGEHAVQAAVLLADQIPHGAVIVAERHAAGRAGVAAELPLPGHASQVVAPSRPAPPAGPVFRPPEQ